MLDARQDGVNSGCCDRRVWKIDAVSGEVSLDMPNSRTQDNQSAYEALRPIMRRFGASCTPREFYWAVNRAYHTVESRQYDVLHAEMFLGLEPVWQRLTRWLPAQPQRLTVLDIGSGTGLVPEYLNRLCPNRIAKVTALDPCQAMLDEQKSKESRWAFAVERILGDTGALPPDAAFDVVTVNSVLHHIVELREFCSHVTRLLKPGGVLLTAQDAPASATSDPVLSSRMKEAQQKRKLRRLSPARLGHNVGAIWERLFGKPESRMLERGTNRPLLEQKLISRPMDVASIWAVTDFHIPGQVEEIGRGIAIDDLKQWLHPCSPLDTFTYQFWGIARVHLDEDEKRQEQAWFDGNDQHGGLFASAWRQSS
jgi:ubiquinone/menaquinone biosynthesis C-methylase UbiE